MLKFLIFFFLLAFVNRFFPEFLSLSQNVKGPVKECLVSEYSIESENSNISTNLARISKRYYLDSGKILTNLLFDPEDLVHFRYSVIHQYDEKSNLIEMVESILNPDGSLQESYLYQYLYNQKNQLVESKMSNPKGSAGYKMIYKYDEADKLIKQSTYGLNESILYFQTYGYDKYDKLIEMSIFNPIGELSYKLVYKYYNKDNRIGISYFSAYGNLENIYQQKFNESGNISEEFEYKIQNDSGKQRDSLINYNKYSYKSN